MAGDSYQIVATPDEAVRSFFGGMSQEIGSARLSLEGSYFESDRSSFQLTLPSNDRRFLTESDGYSISAHRDRKCSSDRCRSAS